MILQQYLVAIIYYYTLSNSQLRVLTISEIVETILNNWAIFEKTDLGEKVAIVLTTCILRTIIIVIGIVNGPCNDVFNETYVHLSVRVQILYTRGNFLLLLLLFSRM